MDQNIKHRLVGITVIFALAVIFLPMILDGSGVRKHKLEIIIPPQPQVAAQPEFETKIIELQANTDTTVELEPRLIDDKSPKAKIERRISADKTVVGGLPKTPEPVLKKANKTAEKPSKTQLGGDSWVLQVGSFQDRDKALAQRDKLRKSNIAAVFIEQFNLEKTSNFRVRLGPFINRDQSKVAQNKIKAKHDIDGIIMKYER